MRCHELKEAFDKTAEWNVTNKTETEFLASFTIQDGNFRFFAKSVHAPDMADPIWSVSFTRNGDLALTNTGDQFEVFGTLRDILKSFLSQYQPDKFRFTGDPSRASVYSRMAKYISAQHHYQLDIQNIGGLFTCFMFTKL